MNNQPRSKNKLFRAKPVVVAVSIVAVIVFVSLGYVYASQLAGINSTGTTPAPTATVSTSTTPTPSTISGGTRAVTGTLTGRVLLSPTCPVERMPPDPECAPKPYATTLYILNSYGKVTATTVSSNEGYFHVTLAPGSYSIEAAKEKVYPRCSSVPVAIRAQATTTVAVSCDTGIR